MMADLRRAVFAELNSGANIDNFRRNLQRGYLERMQYLMENELPEVPAQFRAFIRRTEVDVSQSDIRAFVRGELGVIRRQAQQQQVEEGTQQVYGDADEIPEQRRTKRAAQKK